MIARFHAGTLVAGILICLMAVALLIEGLGGWELQRSGLPYVFPVLLIVLGAIGVASGLNSAEHHHH